jgi:hypothetical protein
MEKRDFIVKKPSILIAAALLAISTGVASAQSRHHQVPAYGTGVTSDRSGTDVPEADTAGERSSSNVQDAVGRAGYFAPHEFRKTVVRLASSSPAPTRTGGKRSEAGRHSAVIASVVTHEPEDPSVYKARTMDYTACRMSQLRCIVPRDALGLNRTLIQSSLARNVRPNSVCVSADWPVGAAGFEPLHFRNEIRQSFEDPHQYRGD